jgi:hypothetical protein
VRINNNLLLWSSVSDPSIDRIHSFPATLAAGGSLVKLMNGVSCDFSDRQAIKVTAPRKTITLRIRKTGHIAEAVSMGLTATISE